MKQMLSFINNVLMTVVVVLAITASIIIMMALEVSNYVRVLRDQK